MGTIPLAGLNSELGVDWCGAFLWCCAVFARVQFRGGDSAGLTYLDVWLNVEVYGPVIQGFERSDAAAYFGVVAGAGDGGGGDCG